MIKGRFSPVFLWALEKQKWLNDYISTIKPGDSGDLEWFTNESKGGKLFMIIKISRREDGHAAVAIHRLENDGKFWSWEKHRWDETESKTGFGFMSLIRAGRYPAAFRKGII